MGNLETLTLTYTSNVNFSRLNIPDCHISNVFFLCMSMSVSVDSQGMSVLSLTSFSCVCQTIRNGQSRETDIDIQKEKTLEMGQSGMDNLETRTLTYTRKRR
jgi:hypothetical protein